MYRLHAAVTGFPLAVCVLLLILECWCGFVSAGDSTDDSADDSTSASKHVRKYLTYCLLLFVGLVFVTGYAVYLSMPEMEEEVAGAIEKHFFYGKLLLFILVPFAVCSVLRIKEPVSRGIYFFYCCSFLLFFFALLYVSFLGGELVFRYGVGVG